MNKINRYNHLNEYLKNKFNEKTLKICIDGGFTCPNRDGKINTGGCIFCSERGSGEHLKNIDISKQVTNHLNSYKGKRANKFIVYFQNFTNTYDTLKNLKEKYDSALIDERIVGIAIATRPDCLDEEKIKLIKSYSKKYYVWVELGLQTANENTSKIINRGFNNFCFSNAVNLLNKYKIDCIVHLMIGLPGETNSDLEKTIQFINKHNIQGLKIHSTYVIKNTKLADLYLSGNYSPISLENYINSVAYILTHIDKTIIIHRLTADAPKDQLLAPTWNTHKKWVLNGINKLLEEKNLYQGMYI